MNPQSTAQAKDPDLRSAFAALWRASDLARKTAIQTDTDLVIVKNGRLVLIDAKTLREDAASKSEEASKIDRKP